MAANQQIRKCKFFLDFQSLYEINGINGLTIRRTRHISSMLTEADINSPEMLTTNRCILFLIIQSRITPIYQNTSNMYFSSF